MVGPETDGSNEFGLPRRRYLVWSRVDQVDVYPGKFGLSDIECSKTFRHRMRPTQKGESGIIQRLKPQRHTVDASRRQIGKPRRLDRRRVGLKRDFNIVREPPMLFGRLDKRCNCGGRHQRRRAATAENRGQRSTAGQRCLVRHVGKQRRQPSLLIDSVAHMAVEIAIRAFGNAERPVDVEGEGGGHCRRQNTAATSLAKASARWLIACLSAGSSSAKLCSRPSGTNTGS